MSKGFIEDTTLTAIGNAIRGKTGKTDLLLPSEMPSAIQSITTGGGQTGGTTWSPEPDWWDIKTIIENDTETYGQQKVIFLLTDQLDDKAATNTIRGFQYYKTSDGQVFNKGTSEDLDISNIFDTSKDKECSKGYKTRYIIGYINSTSILNIVLPLNAIYIIASNIRYSCIFEKKYYLQAIEHINNAKLGTSSFTSFQKMFSQCYSLQSIPEIDTSNGTNFSEMFTKCYSLKSIPKIDTSKGTNFNTMFSNCYSLKSIPEIDTSKGTNYNNMFINCYSLQSISQLNISEGAVINYTFSNCSLLTEIGILGKISNSLTVSYSPYLQHSTLIKILNVLKDQSKQVGSFKLTMGSTNLSKLTDEEKAIATNKNWTLA